MEQRTRVFPAALFSPNSKAFHIVAELVDEPGALAKTLDAIRRQVNITSSMTYAISDRVAVASIFAYATSPSTTEETLEKAFSKSSYVRDVNVFGSSDGFVIDTFHRGTMLAPGQPVVLLPLNGMVDMFQAMIRTFGTGGSVLLFQEGMAIGKQSGSYWRTLLGEKFVRGNIGKLLGLYGLLGWGQVKGRVGEEGRRYSAEVEDCMECSKGKGQGCYFIRGHMVGVLSTFFGSDFQAEETKCRFRGDPRCEFHFESEKGRRA